MAGTHIIRGGYVLDASKGDRLDAAERLLPAEAPPLDPQVSIFRRVSKHGVAVDGEFGWNESLQRLGENKKNRHRGQVAKYVDMTLVFVDEDDMNRMLYKKKPELFDRGQRSRLSRYMLSLSGDYRAMVHRNGDAVIERQDDLLRARLFHTATKYDTECDMSLYEDSVSEEPTNPDELAGLWGYLVLSVLPDLEGFDKDKLGVVFEPNDNLQSEMNDTMGWLRASGFDTNLMQGGYDRPYVPIFNLRNGFGSVEMSPEPMPSRLEFEPPRMFTDTNSQ
jgi:hypothetical protein